MENSVSRFWKSFNREQKLSIGLFCILTLVIIPFGLLLLRRDIIYPYTTSADQLIKIKAILGQTDAEKELELKKKDTDGDGVSDWDEMNVYYTSPYLADTDSDGVPDNIELAQGTDPNCPKGQNCGYIYTPPDASSVGSASLSNASSSQAYGTALPLVPDRNPNSIRAYLRAQGVSEQQLNGYSDQQLLDAYDQSQQDFNASASSTSSKSQTATSTQTTSDTVFGSEIPLGSQ